MIDFWRNHFENLYYQYCDETYRDKHTGSIWDGKSNIKIHNFSLSLLYYNTNRLVLEADKTVKTKQVLTCCGGSTASGNEEGVT